MKIRVVQIWGFLMTVLGWIFVACTMAMEGWKINSIGGMAGSSIIKVAWYWSSLWRSCYTDSTAVTNCYDFPVLWSVEGHVQIVRGLLMAALSLGMLGFVLSLLGMECTFIGGKDKSKYKKIYTGGWCHIISGMMSASGYGVYAQYVSMEHFNPEFSGLKYHLGAPLFLGWVGSAFHMTGGFFYLWSVCRPLCGGTTVVVTINTQPDIEQKSTTALSTELDLISRTKHTSISELSSKRSDVSEISSRLVHTSKPGRMAKTKRTSGTVESTRAAGTRANSSSRLISESGRSSSSSTFTLSESQRSRSSRTASSLSAIYRKENLPFVKNSYL